MPQKTLSRSKKQKAKKDDPYPDLALDRCYLAELPLEVLANILGYVYPIDLLTLSRTNAYFHRTLRDPQQQHIWKTARVLFSHATIPDPVRISEVRVASLLFDDSKCSICKDASNVPLKSHVYPTRVCSPPAPEYSTLVCGIIPSKDVIAPDPYAFYHTPVLVFQRKKKLCRKSDLEMVMKDIKAGLGKAELEAKYKCTFEETAEFNRYMVELETISSTLIRLKCEIDGQIKKFNHKFSVYKGKEVRAIDSPQFAAERRRALRSYRGISQEDWDTIPPRAPTQNPTKPAMTVGQIIIQEMDQMVAKSKRRKDEDALRNTREAVKEHWEYMLNASGIAGDSGTAVPRWNEFAALPVVNSLLKPTGHDEALGVKDLKKKDSTLAKLIQSDINSWDNRTQAQFRKILKVPKAPTIKKNEAQEPGIVSPLDQVTALFECTKCKALGKGVVQEGTLTFRSAVKHRCPNTSSTKFKWSTDLFQPDQYAIQVARHAIALSGLTEDKTKRSDMDALGARFRCKLCTGKQPIYLSYHNLIGHLKRHEAKELQDSFEYLKEPPVLKSKFPSSDGLVEMRRRGATKGFSSHPDSKDFFTCRHCDRSMLWNGLVSHVKKKHSFSDIRDEDFYPNRKEF